MVPRRGMEGLRMIRSGFEKGSGCYKCRACGKLTRSTGRGDNEHVGLCADCYDDAGQENLHSDEGHEGAYADCAICHPGRV